MLRLCSALVLICACLPVLADVYGNVRVIDADTIDVGSTRVRLHAIDAPEQDQICKTEHGMDFACGAWASAQVVDRFEGAYASCTQTDIDRYGRVVATCQVNGIDMGQ